MHDQARKTIPSVVVRRTVRAKKARVFEAWTKPELMAKWFFPDDWSARSSNDLRVGGRYEHEMIAGSTVGSCEETESARPGDTYMHWGEYLEIAPTDRLVFTWNSPAVKDTRVTVELFEREDGTEIVITHELLATEPERRSHEQGWGQCLTNLERLVA
jgi:uncharacterized protein YndB with AHSA1/START domain